MGVLTPKQRIEINHERTCLLYFTENIQLVWVYKWQILNICTMSKMQPSAAVCRLLIFARFIIDLKQVKFT